ncbi:hypothetical protein ACRN9J_05270 [Shewanella baltica]|uniref:hypothetical protein n=1 Tax=Shewanella baltica TaxID=62322 RepID=UPI003D7B5A95
MQNGAKQNQIALIWCVLLVQDKFCWQVSVQIVSSGYKAKGSQRFNALHECGKLNRYLQVIFIKQ